MKITNRMKKYVESQLDEIRRAADHAAKVSYEEKREAATKEIEDFLNTSVYPVVEAICEKYGMDTEKNDCGYYKEPSAKSIIKFFDYNIKNVKTSDKLRADEQERCKKQYAMMENFLLECDLGCDKEEFFKMVEDMKAQMTAI